MMPDLGWLPANILPPSRMRRLQYSIESILINGLLMSVLLVVMVHLITCTACNTYVILNVNVVHGKARRITFPISISRCEQVKCCSGEVSCACCERSEPACTRHLPPFSLEIGLLSGSCHQLQGVKELVPAAARTIGKLCPPSSSISLTRHY